MSDDLEYQVQELSDVIQSLILNNRVLRVKMEQLKHDIDLAEAMLPNGKDNDEAK
jgi:hypothetical protein